MTNPMIKHIIQLCLILSLIGTLGACGQKGPLEVERTQTIQEEESEPTK